jgi:methyl-accepting chemotaxis protein
MLMAVIEETVFLKDHDEESLKKLKILIAQAVKEAEALTVASVFDSSQMGLLTQFLKKYLTSLDSLAAVIREVDQDDLKLTSIINEFNMKSDDIVGMINEHESDNLISLNDPNPRLLALRDIAKSAVIVENRIFAILKNQLGARDDARAFQADCERALSDLKNQRLNAETLMTLLGSQEGKEYPEYVNALVVSYTELNTVIQKITDSWTRKTLLQTERGRVSAEVQRLREEILNQARICSEQQNRKVIQSNMIVYGLVTFALLLGGVLISRSIVKSLMRVISGLSKGMGRVTAASDQVFTASRGAAAGASHQAGAIEEISSSLDEMASMTRQNADSAGQANEFMIQVDQIVHQANEAMTGLTASMNEISQASEETQKIIKTIDEIAFQTNLLALNAAIEAARAGEAGAGFAVVAGEVRNLAMRSAQAAQITAVLIEDTVKKITEGGALVERTNGGFREVASMVARSAELVNVITGACREQADGIAQISSAINDIGMITQQNSTGAGQSELASQEMNDQARQIQVFVAELETLVGAGDGRGKDRRDPKGLHDL